MSTFALAVGGTGGHLFPALYLADCLHRAQKTVHFVGIGITPQKSAYHEYPTFSLEGKYYRKRNVRTFVALLSSVKQCIVYLRKHQVACVIGFGSYHSIPPLLAAWILRIPIVLCEANVFPGKANRWFSRLAQWTAVQFSPAQKFLFSKTRLINFLGTHSQRTFTCREHEDYYPLDKRGFTLLIVGGSLGAHALNILAQTLVPFLKNRGLCFQVLHFLGRQESEPWLWETLYQKHQIRCVVKPFEENMAYAYSAASFAIARAGAATVMELVDFCVPALLVPYPHAADQHQLKNALFFRNVVSGGEIFEEGKGLIEERVIHFFDRDFLATKRKNIAVFQQNYEQTTLAEAIMENIR